MDAESLSDLRHQRDVIPLAASTISRMSFRDRSALGVSAAELGGSGWPTCCNRRCRSAAKMVASDFAIQDSKIPGTMAKTRSAARPRASGQQFLVHDRAGFAAVIGETIADDYDGSRNAAALAVGVPHNTLKRFHQAAGGAVRQQTLLRLLRLVGPTRRRRLESAVLSPRVLDVLRRYDEWIEAEQNAAGMGIINVQELVRTATDGDDPEDPMIVDHQFAESHGAERAAKLQRRIEGLVARFSGCLTLLARVSRRHREQRVRLAYMRIFAPLLHAVDTSGMERDLDEMSEGELRSFIKAGAVREAILLKREADLRRAQDVALRLDRRASRK